MVDRSWPGVPPDPVSPVRLGRDPLESDCGEGLCCPGSGEAEGRGGYRRYLVRRVPTNDRIERISGQGPRGVPRAPGVTGMKVDH